MGDDALVGRVLDGRYLIGERIARGGMASVFLATDQRLDREVAIKIMHHGLGDDIQFRERFVREARAAAQLNHRNVVSVFDQGTDGEITYLVMEYVPGKTLRDIIREESPMPPRRALQLLEQVLIAISAAHRAKIIHRDIKPENVLITPEGDIKVADFGLARAISAATTATGGTLIGTVSYLAPEIVVNEGADARSDVYACGALLYELLTGEKPHAGDSPIQVAYKHVHEDIGPPSLLVSTIPPYLDALVARATVRDKAQRSTDAGVLLHQVRLVQRALAEGLQDDPELTADLQPKASVDEPTAAIDLSAQDDLEATELVALRPPERRPVEHDSWIFESDQPEATMQWSAGTAQAPPTRNSGFHPPISDEQFRAAHPVKKKQSRGPKLLIIVVLLALLSGAIGWYYGVGRYRDAPQLIGLSETQAEKEAEESGFSFVVDERHFSEVAALGTVMSTDPGPGSRILPGTTIQAVISKGKERYKIPKLRGKTLVQATKALESLNLQLGQSTSAYDEKIKKDQIIKMVGHKVGDEVKRDTVVDVLVSKGREPINVPDFTGKSEAAANKALTKAGFKVAVTKAFSDTVPQGNVISQSPRSGTKFRNDVIALTVSKGQELFEVPDVKGMKRNDAAQLLKSRGFVVQATSISGGNFTVQAQSPGPGRKLPRGSTIRLIGF